MSGRHWGRGLLTASLVVVVSAWAARAEDVSKRFRVGLMFGGYDTQDEIRSDAANNLLIIDDLDRFQQLWYDPRDDSTEANNLSIQRSYRMTALASYAFTPFFVLEATAGYQRGDVGDVEMQAQFLLTEIDYVREEFNFSVFRFEAGEMTQVPLQLTGMVRFRPKANLNPYLGAGIGYTFIGFEPSSQLNDVSRNMSNSIASFAPLQATSFGSQSFGASGEPGPLSGAEVYAPDTFSWHLAGGMEYSFKKKWAAFMDLRYVFASREFRITFNGGDQLGLGVPNGVVYEGTPEADPYFGAYLIPENGGGLVDGGSPAGTFAVVNGVRLSRDPVPNPDNPAETISYCDLRNQSDPAWNSYCVTTLDPSTPDGVLDPGFYYVKGGSIKYGGVSIQFGVKYTF